MISLEISAGFVTLSGPDNATLLSRMTGYDQPARANLAEVTSSNIAAVGTPTDPTDNRLFIQFKSGDIYVYDNVPAELPGDLIAAPSVGSYFHKHVKSNPAITFKKV